MNTTPDSVGFEPTLNGAGRRQYKHIKVFDAQHDKIMQNVAFLREKFERSAGELGIIIRVKGKHRNTPGQPEAMEFFFLGITADEYIEKLIQRAKAAHQEAQV